MTLQPRTRRRFLAASMGGAAGLTVKRSIAAAHDLPSLTLKQASDLLRSKAISPVDLTTACLRRIEKYNSSLNAFISITAEQALTTAREMEDEQKRGQWRGPLHGIPIALKDNIDTAGVRTTAASELFKDRIPSEDAEVARRLKIAGAVLIGKTNLHEFAYGGSSSISYFGPVHNPWALGRIPGGSSGGSAVAVAADLCFAALGTDTAGSVRIPAAYCGIVGLKPTYGRVSNRGVVPLSWTFDHVGPISKSVEDAALMLAAIAGFDELDPVTVDTPVPDYSRAFRIRPSELRVGIARTPFFDNLDPEIASAARNAIDVIRKMSGTVREVALPASSLQAADIYRIVRAIEAYVYHARWITESPDKYQRVTRERIVQLAAGISAQDYVQARRKVDLMRREIKSVFSTVDLLIMPTMPSPPVLIPEGASMDAVSIRNTSPFDVYGLPAITVPCGFTRSGLPIGLQICGGPFAEMNVLALAHGYEQATAWHGKHPTVS